MAQQLEIKRNQIEISEGRTMNVYNFTVNGSEMPEMRKEDVVPTTRPQESDSKE